MYLILCFWLVQYMEYTDLKKCTGWTTLKQYKEKLNIILRICRRIIKIHVCTERIYLSNEHCLKLLYYSKIYFNILYPSTHTSSVLSLIFEISKTNFTLISYFVRATHPVSIIVLGFVIPAASLSLSLSLSHTHTHTHTLTCTVQSLKRFMVYSS